MLRRRGRVFVPGLVLSQHDAPEEDHCQEPSHSGIYRDQLVVVLYLRHDATRHRSLDKLLSRSTAPLAPVQSSRSAVSAQHEGAAAALQIRTPRAPDVIVRELVDMIPHKEEESYVIAEARRLWLLQKKLLPKQVFVDSGCTKGDGPWGLSLSLDKDLRLMK